MRAAITKVPPASYGGPPQEIQRSLAERCGGDDAEATASSVARSLKACAAILERLAATDPATGPRVLDFDLSLDDPTTCLRLDAATLRALALVDDDSILSYCGATPRRAPAGSGSRPGYGGPSPS